MKVKEESEKVGLKLNIQKTKLMESGPITSWSIDGGNNGNGERLYFGGLLKPHHVFVCVQGQDPINTNVLYSSLVEEVGLWKEPTWVQISTLLRTSCVSLGELSFSFGFLLCQIGIVPTLSLLFGAASAQKASSRKEHGAPHSMLPPPLLWPPLSG